MKSMILGQDRAVPRYTSYPTAPNFREGFSEAEYKIWLSDVTPEKTVSLYVHVPFCPKLCWFCGCHTKITQRDGPVLEYVDFLKKEAAMLSASIPKGAKITHLHFGGGSPTIMTPQAFRGLMAVLRRNFEITEKTEIAVEIDPREFSEALAATYAVEGVKRLSFGVQDLDEKVMTAVNRPQLLNAVYKGMKLAREYGFKGVNIDLMYGLPHQTIDTMTALAENIVGLSPDRISLFGYAHVPWMKKHMRLIQEDALPDISLRYDLFETAARIFEKSGYAAIGIDHFAKSDDELVKALSEGRLRRNFQGYTADAADVLIGMGASAISCLPRGYIQNTIHGPQYRDRIDAGHLPIEKSCPLTPDDRLRADIIEKLMCMMKVDVGAVCRAHNIPLEKLESCFEKLRGLEKTGLVHIERGGKVSIDNRFMVRLACAAFDAYLRPPAENVQRHVTAI